MVREVGLTEHVQTGDGGHQVVVHPQTTHGVVRSGINHHRLLVGVHVGNLLVHLEEVAVLAVNPLLAHAVDGILEVKEHAAAGVSHTTLVVASLLGCTGGNITRSQVTEGGVLALQIIVAITLSHIGGLHLATTNLGSHLTALGHPDTAVVTQRLGHEGQLALVVALHGDAGGVNLGEAGVSEVGTLLPAGAGSAHVAAHGVGGKEEHAAITTGRQQHGVTGVALDFTSHHIAHHDTLGVAVDHYQVHHFGAGVHLDVALADFLLHGLVGTQEQLLAGLTAAVESTLELGTTEGAVVEQTTVFAAEGNALGHALVDDVAGHLGQTIHVGLTGAEVATLHGVVEQTVYGVTVVLVVVSSVDTTLSSDGVSAAGAVLVAEAVYIVAQLSQRGSSSATSQTGTHHEHRVLTAVVGVDELGFALVLGPLFSNGAIRNAGIRHVVAYRKLNVFHKCL